MVEQVKIKKYFALFLALQTAMIILLSLGFSQRIQMANALYIKKELPIYSVETNEKKIAISFDCAWGVEYTDLILKEMERFNVKCTFFAVKFWVDKYPEYVKKIYESGHEIGTHSANHLHMSKLSVADIERELVESKNAIESITNSPVTLFRAPFGEYNDRLITTSRSLGLEVIQWDVDSLDWKDLSANEISLRVISKVKNGSIILCHNNGLHTAQSLALIFASLQNQGYQFVPISQLIHKGEYTIDVNGRQHAK